MTTEDLRTVTILEFWNSGDRLSIDTHTFTENYDYTQNIDKIKGAQEIASHHLFCKKITRITRTDCENNK